MTLEDINSIRSRWSSAQSSRTQNALSAQVSQASFDIQRLVAEIERLQVSCDEITRQYARMCQRCTKDEDAACVKAS